MLKNINAIRVYEQDIEGGSQSSVFNNMYVYKPRLIITSYISAIFHASLYEEGDFELTVNYDAQIHDAIIKPIMGYYDGEYFVRNNVFLELHGDSTGTRGEQRLFKATAAEIINDENNNLTVKITGVGALGIFARMSFGRIVESSAVQYDAYETVIPKFLKITGYRNAFGATPLEHLYRMMILPFGVENSPRDTIVGKNLYCPDMGLWLVQDTSHGTGDALDASAEKIGIQADFVKWASDWMKTYEMGIVSFEMAFITSDSGANYENGAKLNRYTGKMTIRKNAESNLVFRDTTGDFTLTSITITDENAHSQAPLMYGQEDEFTGTETKKISGQYMGDVEIVDHSDGAGLSYGGNVVLDGATYFGKYDINKPQMKKSSYSAENVDTDEKREAACKVLKNESYLNAADACDTINIEGTINVNNNPDIALGDIVTINVLNTFERSVTITGLTYVSEGDGFMVEVEYA